MRAIRFVITATVVVAGSAGATWAILNLLEDKPGIRIESQIAPPPALENTQVSQDVTTVPSSSRVSEIPSTSRSAEIQPPAGPYHWILAEAPSKPVAAPALSPQPMVATNAATPAATATPRATPLPPVTVASRGEATPHAADASAATSANLAPLLPERPVVAAAAPASAGPETVPLPPVIERPAVAPPAPVVADAGSVPLPPRRPAGLATTTAESHQPAPAIIAPPTPLAARAPARETQRVAALPDAAATPAAPATPAQATPAQVGVTTVPVKPAQQDSRAVAAPPPDNRGFFQRLFGGSGQSAAATVASAGSRTAIYDIEAHTVYLPNGEKLEAHSGLGNRFDDPRYVSEKMRGATPPHLYALELRRDLFHGVAALRMNPVGDGNMFGRNGILAHTYMLGPRGDSNGCVSFKDYARFLRAYQNGEITQIAVVPRVGDSSYSVARR